MLAAPASPEALGLLASGLLVVPLVILPQRLIAEVSGRRAPAGRQAIAMAVLAIAGAAVFLLTPTPDPLTRAALALIAECALALAYVDLRWLVIPDLYVAAFAVPAIVGPFSQTMMIALTGAALGGGLLWAVRWLWRWRTGAEGLGLGDVKLAAALGALLGPAMVSRVICASAVLGALLVLGGRVGLKARRSPTLENPVLAPLGACLALTAVAALGWSRLR